MASATQSCAESPLMFTKGSTAIEGAESGMGVKEEGRLAAHRPPARIRKTCTGLLDLLANAAGDADIAGRCHRLKPGGDVDPAAIEIATLDDDIAKIDADAQQDMPIGRQASIGPDHFLLQLDGTKYGIDRAGELEQDAITHDLDDPAVKLPDKRQEREPDLTDG